MIGVWKKRLFQTILVGLLLVASPLPAQNLDNQGVEEIVVGLNIPRLLLTDIFVQYDGRTLFVPILELFRILDFNITRDLSGKNISGYLFNPKDRFTIDLDKKIIQIAGKEFTLRSSDYLDNDLDFFLRIDLFEIYFTLPMSFDFSLLEIRLPLNKEFPAYRSLMRNKEHSKLKAKKVALKDVRTLPYSRDLLNGGVVDWTLSTSLLGVNRTQYFNLATGGMLLGGDLMVSGGGDSREGFDGSQMRYRWHYYYDDNKFFTQGEIGEVFSTGPLGRSLDGIKVTNKPQARRKHFQTIDVTDYLGSGWEVELVIDGRLADFTRTDQNGMYSFNVDIYYGASAIELKMYGPNGEFRVERMEVRVPHNLLPKGQFEYGLVVGKGKVPFENHVYSQLGNFYGVTNQMTVGLSADVPLKSDSGELSSMAVEAVIQPIRNLTLNGNAVPGHTYGGSFSYTQPSLVNVNGGYKIFDTTSVRNRTDQIDRSNLAISTSFKLFKRSFNIRLNGSLSRYISFSSINANVGFSGRLPLMHVIYIGKYKQTRRVDNPFVYNSIISQLIVSSKLYSWIRPQMRVDYDHTENQMIKYGVYLARRLFRTGQLTVSYERNELTKSNTIMATFNIFTNFASFATRMIKSGSQTALSQVQKGSVRYNQEAGRLHFNRYNGVGFGSAILRPFMDNNFNGVFDQGDEYVPGLKAKMQGAGGRPIGDDRMFYYDRLRPYDEYILQIDKYSLDNPLLKPTNENYRVRFNPNVVTSIDVPLVIAGELTGMVKRQLTHGQAGIGGIKIIVLNLGNGQQTEITTFNNGEYYYLGLVPGDYQARVDSDQLETYGYRTEPQMINFTVDAVEGGSVVEDINFVLFPLK